MISESVLHRLRISAAMVAFLWLAIPLAGLSNVSGGQGLSFAARVSPSVGLRASEVCRSSVRVSLGAPAGLAFPTPVDSVVPDPEGQYLIASGSVTVPDPAGALTISSYTCTLDARTLQPLRFDLDRVLD